MTENEAPKIHIDGDWKAEAQAEKQRLADEQKDPSASGAAAGAKPGELPPASFETLISTMATQTLFALGGIPDPRTGQRVAHLELARHNIDLLGVLEEKTKGNLSDEESTLLSTTVYELRQRYIQLVSSARKP